jgi:hypothetical protein
VLFGPELAPASETLLGALAMSAFLAGLVFASWAGRVRMEAPRGQQRDAEEHA